MAKHKLEQLGMFGEEPKVEQPVTENETPVTPTKEPKRVLLPGNALVTYVEPVVEPVTPIVPPIKPVTSAPNSSDLRKQHVKKVEPAPIGNTESNDSAFVDSLIQRAISVSATIAQLHNLDWHGKAGGNLRSAYFGALEDYRGVVSLLWARRPNVIRNTLDTCTKEVFEVERKLELLYPVYIAQNKPEATGQVIEELGLRQARLHDQLDVLEPYGRLYDNTDRVNTNTISGTSSDADNRPVPSVPG